MLVVAVDVVQAPNDKQQIEPMLDKIESLPTELGEAKTLLADTGFPCHGRGDAGLCRFSPSSPRPNVTPPRMGVATKS
jgi:hypothetical protein